MGRDEYHQPKLCQGAMSGAVPLMGLFIYIADGFAKQILVLLYGEAENHHQTLGTRKRVGWTTFRIKTDPFLR